MDPDWLVSLPARCLCQGWCQDHLVVVPHLHGLYGHFPGAHLQTSSSDSPEGGKDKRAVPRGSFETFPW